MIILTLTNQRSVSPVGGAGPLAQDHLLASAGVGVVSDQLPVTTGEDSAGVQPGDTVDPAPVLVTRQSRRPAS